MKKWFENNIMSTVSLGAIIAGAIWFGDIKNLMFTNVKLKVNTEDYIIRKPSAADEKMSIYMDSVNNANAIESRHKRDSLGRVRDSISLLNADQIYQIKEQQKLIIEEIRKVNE